MLYFKVILGVFTYFQWDHCFHPYLFFKNYLKEEFEWNWKDLIIVLGVKLIWSFKNFEIIFFIRNFSFMLLKLYFLQK
jgi:hypothetical protein